MRTNCSEARHGHQGGNAPSAEDSLRNLSVWGHLGEELEYGRELTLCQVRGRVQVNWREGRYISLSHLIRHLSLSVIERVSLFYFIDKVGDRGILLFSKVTKQALWQVIELFFILGYSMKC